MAAMDKLGDRVRQARKLAGLKQADIARQMGISREAVSQWESGKNAPTADKIGFLARLTGVPAEWLLKGGYLDPDTRTTPRPLDDDLSDFVAAPTGRDRDKALEMLKIFLEMGENARRKDAG